MKNTITSLIIASLFLGSAAAEFETWTNKDGNTASMKLIEVVRDGDKASGKFELEDGRSVTLEAATLSEESATRLREWKPEPTHESVFDEMLDGSLVELDRRKFSTFELEQKPEKYYVFYYTASWCPPCRAYTPQLVKFYKRMKRKSEDTFEIFLLTSDREEDAMLEYARDNKMPWPLVEFDKARDVKAKLGHGVRAIPSVIVCDLKGNVVSRDRNLDLLEELLTP